MKLEPLPGGPNPWIVHRSETKLETPWVRVVLHEVDNPAGERSVYGVTEFKNLAIGILPIDHHGYTWIVGQYRFPMQDYTWEIPEGGGHPDIDPLESAKRELREETGIRARKWQLLQKMQLSNSATNELAYLYLATDLDFGPSEPDKDEDLRVRRIHFDELYRRVIESEITDSLTVAAVLRYRLLQLEGFLS